MMRAPKVGWVLLFIAAIALVTFAGIVKAQTLPQTAAQVKLLTTRTTDLVNQINKLTADNTALKTQVTLLTVESNAIRVWVVDLGCKWDKHLTILANKEALTRLMAADPPFDVVRGRNCANDGVGPSLDTKTLDAWPPQPR